MGMADVSADLTCVPSVTSFQLTTLDEGDEDESCAEVQGTTDPIDLLIASAGTAMTGRPLDFVRVRFKEMRAENKRLQERVRDLEDTLSIVQTAQEWSCGKGMTPEQVKKMGEIKGLLEKAKKARGDLQNFSAGPVALYDKLRSCKVQLRREKEEKAQMRERVLSALEYARKVKEEHRRISEQRKQDNERSQEMIRLVQERHKRTLQQLHGEVVSQTVDRNSELAEYSEQVMADLGYLQKHLREVRHETVDTVILEGSDLGDFPDPDDAQGVDGEL